MFSVLGSDGFGPARRIARGDDWFVNWADTPGLFVLPGGDWVAHWLVKSGPSTYAYDVVMARSSDEGASWSVPVSPHRDGTPTEHGFVSYFADSPAAVGVTWLDGRLMARAGGEKGAMTLRTGVLEADGRVSAEAVLDERVCDCCQTASAMTAAGPIVVYRDRSEDETRDHYVIRRTADGWSEPERLHEDNWRIGGCPVNGPAVVAQDERVAAAWFTMGGGEPLVRVAVSADGGRSFEPADTLGKGTAVGRVDLAIAPRGFLLSWIDRVDSSGALVVAGYDWKGRRLWQERIGHVDAGRASGFPRLGVLTDCRPVVAWTGRYDDEQRVRVARLVVPEACADARGVDRPGTNP
ncbi:MAG: hypothetical protein GVY32_05900 [Gammaproteobacteria bacterium]|nr:hypothetical protein [Gammaproteobacteria bacterium]